ncbi:MAG: hypothetical protein GXO25_03740 [Euryarchaeota archaeon]|nr:hypothetical protein [Euryarchaeota archaeon]
MDDDEEKRRVAVISLVALGAAAAYLLKDEIPIMDGVSKTPEPRVEKPAAEPEKKSSEIEKILTQAAKPQEKKEEKTQKKFSGPELVNVSWATLRSILGSRYPGDNMAKIYTMLDEKTRMAWRRGLYNNGVKSQVDKLFVYYDSYYLALAGWKEIRDAFNRYRWHKIPFDVFLMAYFSVCEKLLSTTNY